MALDDYPDLVRDALRRIKEAEDEVTRIRGELKSAVDARNELIQDAHGLFTKHKVGPRAVERETGVGESTVRGATRFLPKPERKDD